MRVALPRILQQVFDIRIGFTILEMMISSVLLVTGTVAILGMFNVAISADASIEKSSIALALAQETMEAVKDASSWDDIDAFAFPRENIGGDYADFDKEVTVSGDPKQVNVIIYWNVQGDERQINLATLFSNYNY